LIQPIDFLHYVISLKARRLKPSFFSARIEAGAAKSISEASRQLAEETGKSAEGIRQRIIEGQKNELYKDVQLSELSGTDNTTRL
jgi:hypothetical protein